LTVGRVSLFIDQGVTDPLIIDKVWLEGLKACMLIADISNTVAVI